MALLSSVFRRICREIKPNITASQIIVNAECRYLSSATKPERNASVESTEEKPSDAQQNAIPLECRFVYPEFLPDPKTEWRNNIREKLERMDMLSRRAHIDIPEFYVGSILAVTSSNHHAPEKASRFVGICIQRGGCGLRAFFILRNVVDHQGMEMFYELYSPVIQKIEVLRLEKRPDPELLYLRDALPEYSTFPLDMEPEILPEGSPVPINTTKVEMKPRPWTARWERQDLKGMQPVTQFVTEKMLKQAKAQEKPWEKYDLMKEYRESITEEEQREIFSEVYSELHQLELTRKKLKKRKVFVKPKKRG